MLNLVWGTSSQRWMSDSFAILRCSSIFLSLAVIPWKFRSRSEASWPFKSNARRQFHLRAYKSGAFRRCKRCHKCDVM